MARSFRPWLSQPSLRSNPVVRIHLSLLWSAGREHSRKPFLWWRTNGTCTHIIVIYVVNDVIRNIARLTRYADSMESSQGGNNEVSPWSLVYIGHSASTLYYKWISIDLSCMDYTHESRGCKCESSCICYFVGWYLDTGAGSERAQWPWPDWRWNEDVISQPVLVSTSASLLLLIM